MRNLILSSAAALALMAGMTSAAKATDGVLTATPTHVEPNRDCFVFHAVQLSDGADLGDFAIAHSITAANTPPLVSTFAELLGYLDQSGFVQRAYFAMRPFIFHAVDQIDCGPLGKFPRAADIESLEPLPAASHTH